MASCPEENLPCAVPNGLEEILEELSTKVFLEQPKNIYACLAAYCECRMAGLSPKDCGSPGPNVSVGGNVKPGTLPPGAKIPIGSQSTIQQLQEQSAILENLQNQVSKSLQLGNCPVPGAFQPGAGQTLGDCVKGKLTCVLGQALDLVKTLEQLQESADACQAQVTSESTQCAPPPLSFPPVVPDGLTQNEICNQIHCLVKYMDQLSHQFDTLLGNSNCPYHNETHWMPQCGEFIQGSPNPMCMDQNGFVSLIPESIPAQMMPNGCGPVITHPSDNPCHDSQLCTCDGIIHELELYNLPPVPVTMPMSPNPNAYLNPPVGNQEELCSPNLQTGVNQETNDLIKDQLTRKPPPLTQSQSDLFGADAEGGGTTPFEDTLKGLTDRIGNVWGAIDLSNSAAAEWSSMIQEFLSNQLGIIQKLLTGQMSLKDAPYQVAFLAISFIIGIILGLRLLKGPSPDHPLIIDQLLRVEKCYI